MTIWRRIRESRLLLILASVIAIGGAIYLYLVFPYIWDRQVAMMQMATSAGLTEAEIEQALLQQMALNLFGWLVPIGLVVMATLFLALRFFARGDRL